jgi:hypothetical protein
MNVADAMQKKNELGIYNLAQIEEYNKTIPPDEFLIQDLIVERSFNVAVGDSHVGKTPLFFQACIAIAAGLPDFLGRQCFTKPGTPILYINVEDDTKEAVENRFKDMNRVLGLEGYPETFEMVNLRMAGDYEELHTNPFQWLAKALEVGHFRLIVIDPIGAIFKEFGTDYNKTYHEVTNPLKDLQTKYNCAFLAMHHLRKEDRAQGRQKLNETELMLWLQNATGSQAIVNSTDNRIGVDTHGPDGILVRGAKRGKDEFPQLTLSRIRDEFNDPIAYSLASSLDSLKLDQRTVWDALEAGKEYQRGDLTKKWAEIHGKELNGGALQGFIDACTNAHVLNKVVPPGKQHGTFVKVVPKPIQLRYKFKPQTWLEEFLYNRHKTPGNEVLVRHNETTTEDGCVRGEVEMQIGPAGALLNDRSAGFRTGYQVEKAPVPEKQEDPI